MKALLSVLAAATFAAAAPAGSLPPIQIVFVIVLENHNWSDFQANPDAPFLNGTLLPLGAHCEQYFNPPGLHPSEPNYLWLEAGTNFGITDDNDPSINHQNTSQHLAAQLNLAGISWKAYLEDIPGDVVPLTALNRYVPRHNPFVFFDDLTGTNNPQDPSGIAHNRPYAELASDLATQQTARYNFIVPNLCDDGHDACDASGNTIRQTDAWLATAIPPILNSPAYTNNGALFITWDEGEGTGGPLGMILLSPLAQNGGYANSRYYTHSSLLRTLQEIFHVTPLLGDAANAEDLSDLFRQLVVQPVGPATNGAFCLLITNATSGLSHWVEASTNLTTWDVIGTNLSSSNSFRFQDLSATNYPRRFYRVGETP